MLFWIFYLLSETMGIKNPHLKRAKSEIFKLAEKKNNKKKTTCVIFFIDFCVPDQKMSS